MGKLNGTVCEVCREPFKDDDDIVYCPDCGAPVHRSCWHEKGECPYAHLHGEGFVWKPAEEEKEQEEPDALEAAAAAAEKDFEEEKYMGVSEREMAAYMNVRSPQQMFRLASLCDMMANGRKVGFNIFSGILVPYYQFYKGLTPLGILALFVDFLTSLPQIIMYGIYFLRPDMVEQLAENMTLVAAAGIAGYVRIGLMLALCLLGDYFYVLKMSKRIKEIRVLYNNGKTPEYYDALSEAGRGSWGRVIAALGVQFVLSMAVMTFIMAGYFG